MQTRLPVDVDGPVFEPARVTMPDIEGMAVRVNQVYVVIASKRILGSGHAQPRTVLTGNVRPVEGLGHNTVNLDDKLPARIVWPPSPTLARSAGWRHQHRPGGLGCAVDGHSARRSPVERLVPGVAPLDHARRAAVDGAAGPQPRASVKQPREPRGALSRLLWGGRPISAKIKTHPKHRPDTADACVAARAGWRLGRSSGAAPRRDWPRG